MPLFKSQFKALLYRFLKPSHILSAGSGEMGCTTAAALNATCGLLAKVSGMEATSGDKVLGYHDREQGLALATGAQDNKSVLGELAANLEGQVLDCCRVDSHRKHLGHHADAIGGEVGFGYEFLAELCHTFLHGVFDLLAESGIFGDGLLHGSLHILGIVEESTDAGQGIRKIVEDFFGSMNAYHTEAEIIKSYK